MVTTSVRADHLDVLWGEMNRFIDTSVVPLHAKDGGPLVVLDMEVRKLVTVGRGKNRRRVRDKISYVKGIVSEKGEGLAGHHAPATFAVIDEASGVPDVSYTQMMTWARHLLAIFNCNPTNNFVKRAVEAGDQEMPDGYDFAPSNGVEIPAAV